MTQKIMNSNRDFATKPNVSNPLNIFIAMRHFQQIYGIRFPLSQIFNKEEGKLFESNIRFLKADPFTKRNKIKRWLTGKLNDRMKLLGTMRHTGEAWHRFCINVS